MVGRSRLASLVAILTAGMGMYREEYLLRDSVGFTRLHTKTGSKDHRLSQPKRRRKARRMGLHKGKALRLRRGGAV